MQRERERREMNTKAEREIKRVVRVERDKKRMSREWLGQPFFTYLHLFWASDSDAKCSCNGLSPSSLSLSLFLSLSLSLSLFLSLSLCPFHSLSSIGP
jgi:hypothetical protein